VRGEAARQRPFHRFTASSRICLKIGTRACCGP
jgi:hypothetical protein